MPIRNPVLCQLSDTQDRRNTAEAAPKSANGTRPVAYTACREEFTFRLERSHNVDGNVAPHTRGLTGMIGLVSKGKRYGVGNLPTEAFVALRCSKCRRSLGPRLSRSRERCF